MKEKLITKFDITALFRRTSRAIEYQTYRGISMTRLNMIYDDPLLMRVVQITPFKGVEIVEGERIPVSAAKSKSKSAKR